MSIFLKFLLCSWVRNKQSQEPWGSQFCCFYKGSCFQFHPRLLQMELAPFVSDKIINNKTINIFQCKIFGILIPLKNLRICYLIVIQNKNTEQKSWIWVKASASTVWGITQCLLLGPHAPCWIGSITPNLSTWGFAIWGCLSESFSACEVWHIQTGRLIIFGT